MHLPSQCVCIHTEGCVCARDTELEQSNGGTHNHTLVRASQAAVEISLDAYLVFRVQATFVAQIDSATYLGPHQFPNPPAPPHPTNPHPPSHVSREIINHSFICV